MAIDTAGYRASFDLLQRDLVDVFEYVEPVSAHNQVYSHRLFSLLLRACTDFESIAKDVLSARGDSKPTERMNIMDYRRLDPEFKLEQVEVRLHLWRPQPLMVFPFTGWSVANPPLFWYADYNAVKHNRQRKFANACLSTVVTAASGLFAIVARASNFEWEDDNTWAADGEERFSFYHGHFSLHGPR